MKTENDELIIRYIDGQLSNIEKTGFEKKLQTSEELREKVEEFRRVANEFSQTEFRSIDEDYFNNIVPAFRSSLEKEKLRPVRRIGYAIIAVLLFISSYFIFQNYIIYNDDSQSLQAFTENLSEEELDEIADYVSDYSWDASSNESIINPVIEDDLDIESFLSGISPEEGYSILSGYQINDLYSEASEEQLQNAYEELLNKEIL